MGLLQAALRTYESQAHLAGVPDVYNRQAKHQVEGKKERKDAQQHQLSKPRQQKQELAFPIFGSAHHASPFPRDPSSQVLPHAALPRREYSAKHLRS